MPASTTGSWRASGRGSPSADPDYSPGIDALGLCMSENSFTTRTCPFSRSSPMRTETVGVGRSAGRQHGRCWSEVSPAGHPRSHVRPWRTIRVVKPKLMTAPAIGLQSETAHLVRSFRSRRSAWSASDSVSLIANSEPGASDPLHSSRAVMTLKARRALRPDMAPGRSHGAQGSLARPGVSRRPPGESPEVHRSLRVSAGPGFAHSVLSPD